MTGDVAELMENVATALAATSRAAAVFAVRGEMLPDDAIRAHLPAVERQLDNVRRQLGLLAEQSADAWSSWMPQPCLDSYRDLFLEAGVAYDYLRLLVKLHELFGGPHPVETKRIGSLLDSIEEFATRAATAAQVFGLLATHTRENGAYPFKERALLLGVQLLKELELQALKVRGTAEYAVHRAEAMHATSSQ